MPSVSHVPRLLELGLTAASQHEHLVVLLGVRRAAQRS